MDIAPETILRNLLSVARHGSFSDEEMQYEQFNSQEGTRIHGFAVKFSRLSPVDKDKAAQALADFLQKSNIGIKTVFDCYLPNCPEFLRQIYENFEYDDRPEPPQPMIELNEGESKESEFYQKHVEWREEQELTCEAETVIYSNQSRIYYDSEDKGRPVMLFLTNGDFTKLGKALGSNRTPNM